MSTFGIEEEFFLLAPDTGFPAAPGEKAREALMSLRAGESSSQHELLDCQIEMATPVCSSAQQALDSIQGFRQGLARTASGHDLIAVSLGTAPLIGASAAGIAPTERYREIHRYLARISSEQYVSGLNVHVSIKNSESGGARPKRHPEMVARTGGHGRKFTILARARLRVRLMEKYPLPPMVGAGNSAIFHRRR
jgi:carboxylate-amine ligase